MARRGQHSPVASLLTVQQCPAYNLHLQVPRRLRGSLSLNLQLAGEFALKFLQENIR